MVIADDSTDESYIIVSDIAKVADNIVLVKQDNKGVSSAGNHEIELASGKHVIFPDGDNWLSRDFEPEVIPRLKEYYDCVMFGTWEYLDFDNSITIIG